MKKKTWKKVMSIALLTALFATGCGTVTSGDNKEASGSAVSGSAVWNRVKKESSYVYSNSTNYYLLLSDINEYSEKDGIVQYKNDGTRVGEVKIEDIEEIRYVDDTGVYYTKICDNEKGDEDVFQLCCLPVEKTSGEDKAIDKAKEEVLLTDNEYAEYAENSWWQVKGNSRYFVYTTYKGNYVRYDRKTKKRTVETPFGKTEGDVYLMGISENSVLLYCRDEEFMLRRQNLDTMEWEDIYKDESWMGEKWKDDELDSVESVQNESFLFYNTYRTTDWGTSDFSVHGYDFRTNRDKILCSVSDIRTALGKVKKEWNTADTGLWGTEMFCRGDRVYLQLQLSENRNQVYDSRYVILSIGMEETTPVYEKGICDAIEKNSACLRGKCSNYVEGVGIGKEHPADYRENAGQCLTMIDNRAFLLFDRPDQKIQFACFDLDTGRLWNFNTKSKEFIDLQRSTGNGDYWIDDFKDDYDGEMEERMWYSPRGFDVTDLEYER
ncbi:MAG: hypothetical protein J1F22_05120 [Lachnospiraceae bacterium]|nr:hypothetical protein [Lachnospiraceae bacterium]